MSWQTVSIEEITDVVTKGTTPTTLGKPFTETGINFIKAEALNGDSNLEIDGFSHIDEETHSLLRRSILKESDVLLTIAGAKIGKCGFVRVEHLPANTNQAVGIIRINPLKANPRFVYYFFKNPRTFRFIQGLNSQAAQPNINLTTLKHLDISLPSKDEQERISHTLSAYDDLIENNRRRIQLLEESARLLYREWFVHLRFPGHEHVKIIDGVPEGWERKPLNRFCKDIRNSVQPKDIPSNTPYIGLEHIPRRSITLGDWSTAEHVISNKFCFESGDILFGKIRPYFHKVGVVFMRGVTSSDAIVIRPHSTLLHSYCLMLLSSDEFVALASKTVREGSKMPRADWNFLMTTLTLLPPSSLLDAFNEPISQIVSQLQNLSLQNKQLQQARDLLLPRLMNGEITV